MLARLVNRGALYFPIFALGFNFGLLSAQTSSPKTAQAATVTDDPCLSDDKLPDGTVANISPLQINDGTATFLTVSGKGLNGYSVKVCPSDPLVSLSPSISKPSTSSALHSDLRALPGASGTYAIQLKNGEKTYNTGAKLSIFRSEKTYVKCGQDLPFVSNNGNLACDYVPMTYDVARQAFGKGIADRFLVVQLTVRNLNRDMEYLFQDVRIGTPDSMHGSLDRKIVRGVSEKTEAFSSRAVAFRLTQAAASTMTGIAGFVGNDLLTAAASLLGGPAKEGLIAAIPDLTAAEIARVDDLGFTTLSTVVAKNSSIPVVAFLSFRPYFYLNEYKALENPDRVKKARFYSSDTAKKEYEKQKGYFTVGISNGSSIRHKDRLMAFWNSLDVEIAGIHVAQADINRPTVKAIVAQTPDPILSKLVQDEIISISGSGFTSVASVILRFTGTSGNNPALPVIIEPFKGQSSIDDTIAQIRIPQATDLKVGAYDIVFTTKDGFTSDTGSVITVTAPLVAADHPAKGTSVDPGAPPNIGAKPASGTPSDAGRVPAPIAVSTVGNPAAGTTSKEVPPTPGAIPATNDTTRAAPSTTKVAPSSTSTTPHKRSPHR